MAINNVRLTTTDPTVVFQAVGQQAVTVMYICNTTANDVNVNVFCIDSSDSTGAGETNMIYSQLSITGNDTYVIDLEKIILNNSDSIEVEPSVANSITVTTSTIAI